MRPDQHKQKQSAKYKKKHGIKDGKKSNEDVSLSEQKCKGKRQTDSKSMGDKRGLDVTKAQPSQKENRQDQEEIENSHIFRRRQLQSNWDRYEESERALQEFEELPAVRGADFSQVLNSAGNAVSHFRLQEEAEWDAEVSENTNGSSAVSLDMADLALSVQCMPLHRVLGIPEHMFQVGQIAAFEKEAKVNYEKWSCEVEPNVVDPETSDEQQPCLEETPVAEETDVLDDILRNPSRMTDRIVVPHSGEDNHQSRQSENHHNTSRSPVEDDLDDLLNLGIRDKVCDINSDKNEQHEGQDLEDLLNDKHGDNQEFMKNAVVPSACVDDEEPSLEDQGISAKENKEVAAQLPDKPSVFKPAVTENLDDWLDSMLDD